MVVLPISRNPDEYDVFVMLLSGNTQRAVLDLALLTADSSMRLKTVIIGYGTRLEMVELQRLVSAGKTDEAERFIATQGYARGAERSSQL